MEPKSVTGPHPLAESPRAVYVHVPFCRHRCGYCNFALVANRDYLVTRYLAAIQREIAARVPEKLPADTIYFGGGTPSHLTVAQLAHLFAIIREKFDWSPDAEISVEANPADVTPQWAAALRDLGVTRVSLGAQSFRQEKLRLLERDHTPHDVVLAIERCRSFADQISLDLMFAAPGETLADWIDDLRAATALPIDHLSTYELTFEKGTRFWNHLYHGRWRAVDEDIRADMFEAAIGVAGKMGWEHYEISSFAAQGCACRHNQVYWNGKPYFGFGPGAASFIDGCRTMNHSSVTTYCRRLEMGQSPVRHEEKLAPAAAAREMLAIGLRRLAGVDQGEFARRSGFQFHQIAQRTMEKLISAQLVERQGDILRLTRRGVFLYDEVAARIVSDNGDQIPEF